MLSRLLVQNYALIKDLDVQFENGLTIITGETGAGKSILLGALSLILGNRADTSVLLEKNEKCIVEGVFRIEDYDLKDFFKDNDIDYDPVTVIRREINQAGKSRAFINDTPVTLNVIRTIGEKLIDIHSQHQTLMLNESSFQLDVIDSFAGTSQLRNNFRNAYLEYRKLEKEYNEANNISEKNKADLEYHRFQLSQLDDAKLIENEQEVLEKEQEILEHAGDIKLALNKTSELFTSDNHSVIQMLKEAQLILSKVHEYLPEGEEMLRRLETAYIDLDDLASGIEKISEGIEADPLRLKEVNERLDTIYSLIQKHRVSNLNELIIKREDIRKLVNSIITGDERLSALELILKKEGDKLKDLASEISGKRRNILPDVEKKVTGLLQQLGMPNARFRIILSQLSDFITTGIDKADFLFSANKQVDTEDLSKIASGGELSRVMLSLKSLLSKNNNLPTIIFDEIDSGVSGEVADKVGQILSGMGKYMQVVNITHLPQVASRGNIHYHVYKDESGDSTITRIKLLSKDERILEVARLLSGSEITETAIRNARELIRSAFN